MRTWNWDEEAVIVRLHCSIGNNKITIITESISNELQSDNP